jgi:hypothetical protein
VNVPLLERQALFDSRTRSRAPRLF